MKGPEMPTKAEVEKHNMSHIPYRSWCPHCVRGQGRGRPRRGRQEGGERTAAVVATDYCFLGQGDAEDQENPVLVMVDEDTGMIFAHVVARKGPDPEAMAKVMADLELLGYRKLVFKTDQEPAMTALQREVAQRKEA